MRLRMGSSVAFLIAIFVVSQTAPQAQEAGGAPVPGDAAPVATAQETVPLPPADLAAGKRLWNNTAACVRCHGWAGNGAPQGPGFPAGANLRELNFDAETLALMIRCGVPSTQMPFFGRGAWYESTCYGMTAEQAGTTLPTPDPNQLTDDQIATLADYIEYQVMGHGPINLADCEAFFGAGANQCRPYQ